MKAIETKLKGCFILEPNIIEDSRGYFFESYNENKLEEILGFKPIFVQDNQSNSSYGVIRGLHMQTGEYAQAKLVRVLEGDVIDVAVDVRAGSETYGQSIAVRLSADNKRQLFIPRGFLHGFSVISEKATFFYKCDNSYNKASEDGVNPLDEEIIIDWQIPAGKMIISEKDQYAQSFKMFKNK
ncbi:dTDP-4-dehydrorhamnose 3,5-epimerase [Chryseobacterium sp. Ch-15]|uniref:dTDP-4-dehydrorhamnose 3,5-epimerase n=1 Tax=Chryseobacterium muglaense TaxID=2893752 RepID=A0A9Q3YV45_9FLAO|nr:dTDP-4-dehydrorhamnose 3,5-epimerase [Chryseobacterium muglaense]MBD3905470.1 dTDP-4-dehydrorhamnose 3,5-epimerase [Chryseobacterium muglaense]MCC9036457.1 dTDP-4-dehydrorhamnose 3,5-epimerase [Chryseobacterium muglaense]MCM2555382.1 dTDP-4-dehydrorhamnose 3,5-epimerase [Chryseobacterium muglaense]